ncbi:hypothetical protein M5D96_010829, partial [Drosophila gunungcola]
FVINDWQICAGNIFGDTCNGDSGGPLAADFTYKGKTSFFLFGIVSAGSKHCNSNGVYTNAMSYKGWIVRTVAIHDYRIFRILLVRMGESDRSCPAWKCRGLKEYDVIEAIPHPQFNISGRFENDIGLLKLQTEVTFNDANDQQICAGNDFGDTCIGDSGGPLASDFIYRGKTSFVLFGIVSYGGWFCNITAAVYTNAMSYKDWVADNVAPYDIRIAEIYCSIFSLKMVSVELLLTFLSLVLSRQGLAQLLHESCDSQAELVFTFSRPLTTSWMASIYNNTAFICGGTLVHKLLQTINLTRLDSDECYGHYYGNQICAGTRGGDICDGDSGGPLAAYFMYRGIERYVQFGIVSLGSKLCDSYSVHTDVLDFSRFVRLGEYDCARSHCNNVEQYGVAMAIQHRDYNPYTATNNIGLLKLRGEVVYTARIHPICIVLLNDISSWPIKSFRAFGWSQRQTLQAVVLSHRSPVECYQNGKMMHDIDKQICAGNFEANTCLENSGGPLANASELCNSASLHTDVTAYRNWIYNTVRKLETQGDRVLCEECSSNWTEDVFVRLWEVSLFQSTFTGVLITNHLVKPICIVLNPKTPRTLTALVDVVTEDFMGVRYVNLNPIDHSACSQKIEEPVEPSQFCVEKPSDFVYESPGSILGSFHNVSGTDKYLLFGIKSFDKRGVIVYTNIQRYADWLVDTVNCD